MTNDVTKKITASITLQIEKSKGEVTILFTDISQSTKFWDEHGDTAGRLMVDQHNKLMFPVIRYFNGTVVKTIGDSIMASFRSPRDAVRAAIGMQQILKRRKSDMQDLNIDIRIAVHTGEAIIEKNDIYGDVVNVAARIESICKGGEILVSDATASRLRKRKQQYSLEKRQSFVPKGKKSSITVYSCDWQGHPSLIDRIKTEKLFLMARRQKVELVVFLLTGLISLYLLYTHYIRYLLADFEFVALQLLNLHPVVPAVLIVGFTGVWTAILIRVKSISTVFLKLVKGGFGFGVVFLFFFLLPRVLPFDLGQHLNGVVYESNHLFVEVIEKDVPVLQSPSTGSRMLMKVPPGTLLLQNEVTQHGRLTWTKVLVAKNEFGYILRQMPPKIGVPAQRFTIANKFQFKYYDLYALLLGLGGFAWGFISFRVRPV